MTSARQIIGNEALLRPIDRHAPGLGALTMMRVRRRPKLRPRLTFLVLTLAAAASALVVFQRA
jgi:hypothetical protein